MRELFLEERFLEKKFGLKYLNWSSETPVFIPLRNLKSSLPFSIKVFLEENIGILSHCRFFFC